ncbi:MAG: hypothetical protein IPJ65_38035 [Archangiaceae bacterium]|nr:hypothetical protein [Archangiaceae bacterium]
MRRFLLIAALTLTACGSPSASDAGTKCPVGTTFCPYRDPGTTKVNNGFLITVTGEGSATDGNPFPPGAGQEVVFKDGWQIDYTHVLVTAGKVVISENPDMSPTDPSQTGPVVAQLDGPFAVDLAKAGPLDSKEMNGKSWRLGRITQKQDGTAFSATTRYAFGFDLVAAQSGVVNVNLDADARALYQTMAEQGFTVLYQGVATWKGDQGTPACRSTVASYDWGRVPKKVNFKIGWKAPVTYQNCVNPDLMPADSRGVQTQANDETIAQVTFHLDHPFWEALEEDAPLRWDAIAARKSVATAPAPAMVEVTEADLVGVDFQSFKDAQAMPMAMRFCGEQAAGEPTTGTLGYDPKSVPVNPTGGSTGLKDLYDYTTYNLATFGHLNNDGLCYPARNYPSP